MKTLLRRIVIAAGVLVGVLILAAGGVYMTTQNRLNRIYTIAPETIPIPTDSASIARGAHLADAIAKCTDCHTPKLSGEVVMDNPALGRFVSHNLTRGKGGIGSVMKDEDWVRAIRHGVGHDGKALRIMPSADYGKLSVEDVGAIIAYVKSVPPVDNELPPNTLGPVGRVLVASGKMPLWNAEHIDHSVAAPALAPPVGPTLAYGNYLVHVGGCTGCHGPTLAGGPIAGGDPAWPPAANITPTGLKAYDEAEFFSVLRTGVRKDGSKIKDPMPIAWTKNMTDDETRAIWMYLRTVTPREFGAR